MRSCLLGSIVLLTACGARTHTGGPGDAGGQPPDAHVSVTPDGGIDAGVAPAEIALGRALTCELDAEGALRAVARHVACSPSDDRVTMVALVEAWEAGLLSQLESSGGLVEGLGAAHACGFWRCAAAASDCGAYAGCVESGRRVGACTPFEVRCDGTTLVQCEAEGTASRALVDCASFGATCAEGRCALGECAFGADYYQLECMDGALTLCDGAIRMECGAWSPGSACTSFHIGGEVPTQWCSPSGMSEYGAYSRPVECDGRTVRFVSVSTREHVLDCLALGYSGCDERGCTL